MNPEQQRIAIAEACGWSTNKLADNDGVWFSPEGKMEPSLPDYLNDLNAMHSAEQVLTPEQRDDYYYAFLHDKDIDHSWTVSATASQRAEAFLRAICKWIES